jgi:hypothetical protein
MVAGELEEEQFRVKMELLISEATRSESIETGVLNPFR